MRSCSTGGWVGILGCLLKAGPGGVMDVSEGKTLGSRVYITKGMMLQVPHACGTLNLNQTMSHLRPCVWQPASSAGLCKIISLLLPHLHEQCQQQK